MGSHELGEQKRSLNTKIPFGHRLLSYIKLNLLDADGIGILMTMMISGLKSVNCPFWNSTAYGNMPVSSGGGVQNWTKHLLGIETTTVSHAGRIYNCPTRVYEFPKKIRHCTIGVICCLQRVGMETDGEVFKRTKKMSLVSLFSAFNSIRGI